MGFQAGHYFQSENAHHLHADRRRLLGPAQPDTASEALKLFYLITTPPEQSQESIRPTDMGRAHHHKVGLTAAHVAFNFRDPVSISPTEEPISKRGKITKRFVRDAGQRIGIASTPGIHGAGVFLAAMLLRNEGEKQQRFAL